MLVSEKEIQALMDTLPSLTKLEKLICSIWLYSGPESLDLQLIQALGQYLLNNEHLKELVLDKNYFLNQHATELAEQLKDVQGKTICVCLNSAECSISLEIRLMLKKRCLGIIWKF